MHVSHLACFSGASARLIAEIFAWIIYFVPGVLHSIHIKKKKKKYSLFCHWSAFQEQRNTTFLINFLQKKRKVIKWFWRNAKPHRPWRGKLHLFNAYSKKKKKNTEIGLWKNLKKHLTILSGWWVGLNYLNYGNCLLERRACITVPNKPLHSFIYL